LRAEEKEIELQVRERAMKIEEYVILIL